MKKGQSAIEFLMTYGWAMITIAAVVTALVIIMPNSGSLTRTKCTFPAQMPCVGAKLSQNNLTLSMRNGAGGTINNVAVRVISPSPAVCTLTQTTFKADEQFFITCPNAGTMNKTDATKFRLQVTYMKSQGSYNQTLTGETFAKYSIN